MFTLRVLFVAINRVEISDFIFDIHLIKVSIKQFLRFHLALKGKLNQT
jgi:hypothetical protein